jgi:excisionase family DNA binding protein
MGEGKPSQPSQPHHPSSEAVRLFPLVRLSRTTHPSRTSLTSHNEAGTAGTAPRLAHPLTVALTPGRTTVTGPITSLKTLKTPGAATARVPPSPTSKQEGAQIMTDSDTGASGVPPHTDVQLYRVIDAMRVLRMSRTVVFELLRSGRLRSVRQGRTRLIPASAIRDYIALLEKETGAA